jgi:hypothetical protein
LIGALQMLTGAACAGGRQQGGGYGEGEGRLKGLHRLENGLTAP